ncbi:MAG: 5-formyltetrahydrofolate cyclo-ligase [Thermodesulfobacteriota bacterium]
MCSNPANTDERRKLRKTVLARRDSLTGTAIKEKSSLILDRFLTIEELSRASCVMLYVNYRSEVNTRPLIAGLRDKGITVAAPVIDADHYRLIPYIIENASEDLIPGYCGIPEPDAGKLPELDPAELDIVLVPGSVFDPAGGRLGYGGGYYDRFLSREAPHALAVGLAYELQIVTKVPLQDHDIFLDRIVTEERLLNAGKRPQNRGLPKACGC